MSTQGVPKEPTGPVCANRRCARAIYALQSPDGLVWRHVDPKADGGHAVEPYDPYPDD